MTKTFGISRRGFVETSVLAGLASASPALGRTAKPAAALKLFTLEARPTRVFKTMDRSHERTESWIFSLAVQTTSALALTPAAMTIDLLKGADVLRSTNYPREGFGPLT